MHFLFAEQVTERCIKNDMHVFSSALSQLSYFLLHIEVLAQSYMHEYLLNNLDSKHLEHVLQHLHTVSNLCMSPSPNSCAYAVFPMRQTAAAPCTTAPCTSVKK